MDNTFLTQFKETKERCANPRLVCFRLLIDIQKIKKIHSQDIQF